MGHIKTLLNDLARFGRHACGLPSPEEQAVLIWLHNDAHALLTELEPYDEYDKLVSGMFDYDQILAISGDAQRRLHRCRKKFQQNAHLLSGLDKVYILNKYNGLKKSISSMGRHGITQKKASKLMEDVTRFAYHIDTAIYIANHPPAASTFGRNPREDGQSATPPSPEEVTPTTLSPEGGTATTLSPEEATPITLSPEKGTATTLSPEEIQFKLDTEIIDAEIENIFNDPQSAWAQYRTLRVISGRFEDDRAKQVMGCADEMIIQAKQLYGEKAHTFNIAQKVHLFRWYQNLGQNANYLVRSDLPISRREARRYHRAVEDILIQVRANYKDSCRCKLATMRH